MDKSKHLESVIKTHQITKEESLLKKFKSKNSEVKESLERNYGIKIYSPFNSGSYAKNTAINTRFDFDLVCPFKRNAFGANGTLKEMYEDVFEFLTKEFDGLATVKPQKVSIGIEFKADKDGDIIKIDVVPGREFNLDQYKEDQNLNLYVYKQYGLFSEGSERLKTNIEAQKAHVIDRVASEKEKIRKIVRLLKIWKVESNKKYKSFFLELFVIKAVENVDVSGNLWAKLETVLMYIRDNSTIQGFKLIDPGNSSNNLMDTLEDFEKVNLKNEMSNILTQVENNDENLKFYFPENQKFVEEEKEQYNTKQSGSPLYVPPKINFG
ncbi:nucleotidyltransferase [Chryseobacterium arthrosphaerae]|uniref:nucleotidyltransferase n=1 Tax=Chryseobacterium arthrosphaerae TaxID=651561 RepID=UPI0024157A4B|nr:nucleotidyltransferase [Chryseobacterium arthrosphaerae]MDG4655035.1 nucleotidyltransferase [Chryseobacterium arthrosphaerae]